MRKTAIIFILLILPLLSCLAVTDSHLPKIQQGILDARTWADPYCAPLRLDGEWEFYWMRLAGPEEFSGKNRPVMTGYIELPGPWNTYSRAGVRPAGYGFATYRMILKLPAGEIGTIKSVRMPFVHSAYRLWINGRHVSSNGTVGESKNAMRPFQLPVTSHITVESDTLEFILQISNFQQRTGGILKHITFGDPQSISAQHDKDLFIVLFATGCIFIIILYHVMLFIMTRAYAPSFLFAVFALIVALRLLLTDNKLLAGLFPRLPWELFLKMEYLTIPGGILSFMFFVYLMYRKEMSRLIVWGLAGYQAAFTVFIIIAPITLLSSSLIWLQAGLLFAAMYLFYIIVYSGFARGKGTLIYIFGMSALFFTMVNDILYSHQLINSLYLMPLGLLIFLFTQSFVTVLLSVETQRRMISINNELDISRRIQQLILPPAVPQIPGTDIQVRYITMDAIGGDFYHFHVIDEKNFGVLVSDVTGHGIPASLIASTVNIAFSLQKESAGDPPALLSNMNTILRGQTGGQHVTAAYIFLDLERKLLLSARAGHPMTIVLKKKEKMAVQLDSRGRLLGIFEENTITGVGIGVDSGDKIILYTDGLFEQRSPGGELWGDDHLMEFVRDNNTLSAGGLADALIAELQRWRGKDRNLEDDLTLVIIEIL